MPGKIALAPHVQDSFDSEGRTTRKLRPMLGAMKEELRRTLRLSREVYRAVRYREPLPPISSDPHLRRGFFSALGFFLLGVALALAILGHPFDEEANPIAFTAMVVVFGRLSVAVLFGTAAWSRSRETTRTSAG